VSGLERCPGCHPERSEGSLRPSSQTLRCAQGDTHSLQMSVRKRIWAAGLALFVPLGCLGLLLTWRLPPKQTTTEQQTLDLGGACFLAVGLGALTIGLSFGQEWGWLSQHVLKVDGFCLPFVQLANH